MLDFWGAYRELRRLCPRAEEVALGAEVSVHTVVAWDRTTKVLDGKSRDAAHARNPSHFNRVRLARLAESKGAKRRVVEALKPEADGEASRP